MMEASDSAFSAENSNRNHRLFDFELNYEDNVSSSNNILFSILEGLSSYKRLHNWDAKLARMPLKELTSTVRAYLDSASQSQPSDLLLSQADVEEVFTLDGVNYRQRVINDESNVRKHLFFSKVCPSVLLL